MMNERPLYNRNHERGYDWVLSHQYAVGILCFINDNGEVMVKDLLKICSSHRTLTKTVTELMDNGLVDMRVEEHNHTAKLFSVTYKGKTVAEQLDCIRLMIEGYTTIVKGVLPIENY